MRAARDGNANLAPHRVDHLPGLELRNIDTAVVRISRDFRAGNANRGQLVADVLDLDIVHDDVAIEKLGYQSAPARDRW